MSDTRAVAYVIGLAVFILGLAMLPPLAVDLLQGRGHWRVFAFSAVVTIFVGGLVAIICADSAGKRLSTRHNFILTTMVWVVLPFFAAMPFIIGATAASFTDAFFEAMSGLTTTGSTVFVGLETLPGGLLLWRGITQWIGGVGIIMVALIFLPELRLGGMQLFRTQAFDTGAPAPPRITQMSARILGVYLLLTLCCAGGYLLVGQPPLDATVHAMTTVATGGFANHDSSFGDLGQGAQIVAIVFMMLAALPFIVLVRSSRGIKALTGDPQVRGFVTAVFILVLAVLLWRWWNSALQARADIVRSLFNTISIITGTGFSASDYTRWGSFVIMIFFLAGLVGGCAGSTTCSVKIFRYQLLFAAMAAQIRRLYTPHAVSTLKYNSRPVDSEVLGSVMAFFAFFFATLFGLAAALGMTGLNFVTALSGAASALANIGPGLGDQIGPAGNFSQLNPVAKWLLLSAMLIGRLELMAVYVLFTISFWRQ